MGLLPTSLAIFFTILASSLAADLIAIALRLSLCDQSLAQEDSAQTSFSFALARSQLQQIVLGISAR